MSVVQTIGFHNIAKIDIVPKFVDGVLEYVDLKFYDANREDEHDCDEVTVWATRKGASKGRLEIELEGDPVGLICATPFNYAGSK